MQEFVEASTDWLVTQPPSDVVLSSALGYLVIDGVAFSTEAGDPAMATMSPTRQRPIWRGLGETVARLTEAGHRVTVVYLRRGSLGQSWPTKPGIPTQCATFEALSDIAGCGASRAEQDVIDETRVLFAEVVETIETNGGTSVDPRGQLCRAGTCATNFGNDWIYLDGSHLSVSMSERLSPLLVERLVAG